LFIFFSSVLGLEEIVFDDYIESGSAITLDSQNYSIIVNSNNIKIQSISSNKNIDLEECEDLDSIRFCYLNKNGDLARIQISYLLPNVEITREIDKNVFFLGEEVTGVIRVTNYGDYFARNFSFVDDFPEEIIIESVSGDCQLSDNTISLDINKIEIDEILECEFSLVAKKIIDLGLTAKYSYFDGFSTKEDYTSRLLLKTQSGFDTVVVVQDSFDVGDNFEYLIEFDNNNEFNLDINLRIILPEGIEFDSENDFIFNNSALEKSFTLKNLQNYDVSLIAKKPGVYDIITQIEYSNEDLKIADNKIIKNRISVSREDLDIFTNFDKDTEIAQGGQKVILDFEVYNPNKDMKFVNLEANFNGSDIFIEPVNIDNLNPFQRQKILQRIFVLPILDKKENFQIKLVINYETEYGEKLSLTEIKNIQVEPVGEITVKYEIEEDIIFGKNFVVSSFVKNTKLNEIERLCIKDSFEGLTLVKGVSSVCFELEPEEERKILTYTLLPNNLDISKIKSSILVEEYDSEENLIKTNLTFEKDLDVLIPINKNEDLKVKITPEQNTIYNGQIVNLNFEITNEGNIPFQNISYNIEKNKFFDYYNDNIFIRKINPGEKINIESGFKLRAKKTGEYEFKTGEIFFISESGEIFSNTISSFKLNIKEETIQDSAIIIYRNFNLTHNFTNYTIQNIGQKSVEGNLVDSVIDLNEYFVLNGLKNKTIKVDLNIINKSQFLKKINNSYAYIKYNYLGNITTYSPIFFSPNIEKKKFEDEPINLENQTEINNSFEEEEIVKINLTNTNNQENLVIVEEKKSIFIAIFEFLMGFFK